MTVPTQRSVALLGVLAVLSFAPGSANALRGSEPPDSSIVPALDAALVGTATEALLDAAASYGDTAHLVDCPLVTAADIEEILAPVAEVSGPFPNLDGDSFAAGRTLTTVGCGTSVPGAPGGIEYLAVHATVAEHSTDLGPPLLDEDLPHTQIGPSTELLGGVMYEQVVPGHPAECLQAWTAESLVIEIVVTLDETADATTDCTALGEEVEEFVPLLVERIAGGLDSVTVES